MAIGEFQPIPFIDLLGGLGNLPTAANATAIGQQQQRNDAVTASMLQQTMLNQQAMREEAAKQQRQALFQQAWAAHFDNPTPASAMALVRDFPEYAKQFEETNAARDKAAVDSEIALKSAVFSRANAGAWEQAAAKLQAYIDAARQAGADVSDETAMVELLRSPDPEKRKQAKAMLSGDLAFTVGPDKWADMYGNKVVSGGGALLSPSGEVLYQAPEKPQYQLVDVLDAYGNPTGAKRSVRTDTGDVGAGGASGGGFDAFYQGWLAPTEGGYAARDGKSGAPVNFGVNQAANPDVDVAKLTQPEAAQLLEERYWKASGADRIPDPALAAVHADTAVNMGVQTAQRMLAASGSDVGKYLKLRENRYRALGGPDLPAWLKRNEALGQYVSGGASPAGAPAIGARGKSTRDTEEGLRKEFHALPIVKEWQAIASAFNQVRELSRNPTAASDIGMIFSYMKMLDPGSTVREGEFATAQNAAGVPDRVTNVYNNALNGERLNPEQRADFVASAAHVVLARKPQFDAAANQYRDLAKQYGVSPDRVARPSPTAKPKAAVPEVGTVSKGYRFKGGNPANPASWEKVS